MSSVERILETGLRIYHRYNLVAINESLEKKLGTHEAVFYQLTNDEASDFGAIPALQ